METQHIEPLTTLPMHHGDPFDRLIAATALVEGMTLASADAAFDAYGSPGFGSLPSIVFFACRLFDGGKSHGFVHARTLASSPP